MKINFICMDLGINGGTKDIIELANALHDQGHKVNVIYPKWSFPNPFNKLTLVEGFGMPVMRMKRELLGQCVSDKIQDWIPVRCNLLKVPTLSNRHIPDADFTFATWWETVSYVKKLSPSKGKKCYYIQHYEVWGGNEEKVKQTYREGFINIVHSSWLKNIIWEKVFVKVNAVISHAPDHATFKVTTKKVNKELRVMMITRNIKWKGMRDGLKAFEYARRKCKIPLKLVLVGERMPDIPIDAEFHEHPPIDKINELYNSADIFLFPSLEEGFGLPPLEAMCCQTAVVTTRVGAVSDYASNKITALISHPGDVISLSENIEKLVNDEKLRCLLARNAYFNVQFLTWDKTATKIIDLLENEKNKDNKTKDN